MPAMPAKNTSTPFDPTPLVARASGGDQAAWSELVRMYSPRLYALVKSRLRDHDAAEEITQSVFVTLATHLSSGAYKEQGLFEPWLFRITMNRVRDEARRRSVHATPTDPHDLPPHESFDEHRDDDQFTPLRAALAQLPDDDREIIELRHHAGLPFKTIAAMLDTPIGTLLARHHRALRKLKSILETDHRTTGPTP